jgi:hypothetical protein
MKADETRIPRRSEGGREFQETCNGGPSKAKDICCSEEPAEGQALWQEQGLERFLFPRPCLRVVWLVRILAGKFGIGETLPGAPGIASAHWIASRIPLQHGYSDVPD